VQKAPVQAGPPPLPTLPQRGVRGIHVTGWIAGGKNSLNNLIGLTQRTEINAFVVDIIDNGQLSYDADVPLAISTKASKRMFRIDRVVEALNHNKVWSIARIACMRNTPLAKARPDLAIHNSKGGVWQDGSGYAWLNPYKQKVWDYSVDLALDAIKHGFNEIQFDYVRFPSYHVSTQVFPNRPAKARNEDQIAAFLAYAAARIHAKGVWFSADVFGLTSLVKDDEGIGQKFQKLIEHIDYLCPMVYPSHYHHGEYGIKNPDTEPYKIITLSVGDAKKRLKDVSTCKLRPWIQDFSLGNHYGPAQVQAEIKALNDLGITEYLLWNPLCKYTEAGIPKREIKQNAKE
jgi:hypothetical protein